MLLVIGNKNYSSWSLRPWLAMKVHGMPFDEKRVLYASGSKAEIVRYSILEYLAERQPRLWPRAPAERAKARAIAFLYGEFTAADAMLALPAMREWIEAAEREPESIPELDLYE